jgi:hypothetical protein
MHRGGGCGLGRTPAAWCRELQRSDPAQAAAR